MTDDSELLKAIEATRSKNMEMPKLSEYPTAIAHAEATAVYAKELYALAENLISCLRKYKVTKFM